MTIQNLPLDAIHVPAKRLRDFDPAWVEALTLDVAARGLLQPIVVRPRPRGGWWLVAGRYRLEALRGLGRPVISATIIETPDDAAVIEAEGAENLVRAELIPLDLCRTLHEMKVVHDAIHGERRGGDRRSQAARAAADQKCQVGSFDLDASSTAFGSLWEGRIGLSSRAILRCVAIWERLSPASRGRLVGTSLAANQSELQLLSDQSAQRQSDALDLILDGEHPANSVAAALDCLDGGGDMSREDRKFSLFAKAFATLPDERLDQLLVEQEERVIASLRRRGRV